MTSTEQQTLAGFLLERIAEDQAAALACFDEAPAPWTAVVDTFGPDLLVDAGNREVISGEYGGVGTAPRAVVTFMADRGPARVLAECEAKRRIVEYPLNWPSLIREDYRDSIFLDARDGSGDLEQWERAEDGAIGRVIRRWSSEDYARFVVERVESPILRLLALPYSDHPAFRQEWQV